MKEKYKELWKEIEIPEGTSAEAENNEVVVSKGSNSVKRRFSKVSIEKKENRIIVKTKKSTKREKKLVNSAIAHIKNMFRGAEKKFVYKLQICAVHFPMNVSVKGNMLVIKNFIGEAKERKTKIFDNVEVKVEKDIIEVSSPDKEAAGQTAANIEKVSMVRNRDRRVFQDGIFIIETPRGKI